MATADLKVSVNDLTACEGIIVREEMARGKAVKAKLRNFMLKKENREIYTSCLCLPGNDLELLRIVTWNR